MLCRATVSVVVPATSSVHLKKKEKMKTYLFTFMICLSPRIWGQVDNDSIGKQNIANKTIENRNDSLSENLEKDSSSMSEISFPHLETDPIFNDGDLNDFRNWCQNKINYPVTGIETNVEGRVVVCFTIDTTGAVVNVHIIRSSGCVFLDAEALRVVKSSPKWIPGYNGESVTSIVITMPLNFK